MPEYGDQLNAATGKVEFIYTPRGLQFKISGNMRAVYQIAIGMDGRALAVVPFAGYGGRTPPYPQPSMLAWIQSDEQGLWGRECPDCRCYFRSNHIMGATFCPYCGKVQDSLEYVTDAQAKYVETFCQSVNRAFADKKTITLNAAEVTDEPPPWQYTETKQQFHFDCGRCHARTDILGDYGFCPGCGRTNGDKLIEQRLTSLQERMEKADEALSDKRERGEEWERITIICFEAFEPLGNHLRQVLALVPATPKRRAEIQNLNFQRIFETATKLEQYFGIELLDGIGENDRAFLKKMLQRRHILTHNGGKVDQDYLDNSADTSVRLNERIRIRSNEIRRLIPIVRTLATNLMTGFNLMSFGDFVPVSDPLANRPSRPHGASI